MRNCASKLTGPKSYAALRTDRPPNGLILYVLDLLGNKRGRALDIGAGPLNDTRLLLQAGMTVDAIDTDPLILSAASHLNNPRLTAVLDDIRSFRIEPAAYSLIVAIHTLPFLRRADLPRVMSSIVGGLVKNGILCCTFFGGVDSWAKNRPRMTFLSRSEIQPLVTGLHPVEFSELAYDGADAEGKPKHWHIFRCIFRK